MKKALAIVLIVCLAFSFAFAAKKSSMKVGAQLGYGGFSIKFTDKENSKNYLKISDGGFYFAGTFEFALAEEISAKAEVGMNLMGKAKWAGSYAGISFSGTEDEKMPAMFAIYAGGQYCFEISKEFCVHAGAGLDVLMGRLDKDESDSFNAAIGLGLEAVAAYHVNDQITVTAGGKFAWLR